ncbi:response regulator [Jhaorihella thermophila]
MMPKKTGPELLKDLRKIDGFAHTPAIFMTAKVQNAEIQSFLDAGAIAVITKPFDPMTLGDQIRAIWAEAEAA